MDSLLITHHRPIPPHPPHNEISSSANLCALSLQTLHHHHVSFSLPLPAHLLLPSPLSLHFPHPPSCFQFPPNLLPPQIIIPHLHRQELQLLHHRQTLLRPPPQSRWFFCCCGARSEARCLTRALQEARCQYRRLYHPFSGRPPGSSLF